MHDATVYWLTKYGTVRNVLDIVLQPLRHRHKFTGHARHPGKPWRSAYAVSRTHMAPVPLFQFLDTVAAQMQEDDVPFNTRLILERRKKQPMFWRSQWGGLWRARSERDAGQIPRRMISHEDHPVVRLDFIRCFAHAECYDGATVTENAMKLYDAAVAIDDVARDIPLELPATHDIAFLKGWMERFHDNVRILAVELTLDPGGPLPGEKKAGVTITYRTGPGWSWKIGTLDPDLPPVARIWRRYILRIDGFLQRESKPELEKREVVYERDKATHVVSALSWPLPEMRRYYESHKDLENLERFDPGEVV